MWIMFASRPSMHPGTIIVNYDRSIDLMVN
jgi:hypothetical protein